MASEDPDLREYLAAERTLLAYVRTSLALMGLGFVIARFSLFLREMQMLPHSQPLPPTPGLSVWFGILFILFGAALSGASVVEYRGLLRRLNLTYKAAVQPGVTPIVTAGFAAIIGAAVSLYLFWTSIV